MITATNPISAPTSSSAATPATTADASQDRFLKLLVAQLSNQDPMNPVDNAQMTSQMAQISTVSGVQQVNQTLQSLSAQMASMQMLQGSSLVGHNVLVQSDALAVNGGVASGSFELALPADSVKIDVLSAGGKVIDTVDMGAQAVGQHNFDWTAPGSQASGTAGYRITATKDGNAVATTSWVRDNVISVSSENGAMNLQLQSLGSVAYSTVKSIL
jgi:flagellar basal-body rod modification protein FlgD